MTADDEEGREAGPACPECGGRLRAASALAFRLKDGTTRRAAEPGAWCDGEDCSYGAVGLDRPAEVHPDAPLEAERRRRREEGSRLRRISDEAAAVLADVERVEDVCGGRPVLKGSRLTVECVVQLVLAGEDDIDLLESYPRLNAENLRGIRGAVLDILERAGSGKGGLEGG